VPMCLIIRDYVSQVRAYVSHNRRDKVRAYVSHNRRDKVRAYVSHNYSNYSD